MIPFATRIRSSFRTVMVPWTSVGLVIGMVGAFFIPVALVTSGLLYADTAADDFARRLVGALEGTAAADIVVGGSLGPDASDGIDTLVAYVDGLPSLGGTEPILASSTDGIIVRVDERGMSARPRLLWRPGMLDEVELVAGGEGGQGVFISETAAEDLRADVGSRLDFQSADWEASTVVAGIYRDLFPGSVTAFWDALPFDLQPRYLTAFDSLSTELVLAPQTELGALAPPGSLRLVAELTEPPTTVAELDAAADRVEAIADDFRADPALRAALSGVAGSVPEARVDSELPATRNRAVDAGELLSQPVLAVANAGIALGALVTIAGAAFSAGRQRRSLRLLVAEGAGPIRIGGRAIAQAVLPAVVGASLGLGLALGITAVTTEGAVPSPLSVDLMPVAMTVLGSLVAVGVVTALIAPRFVDEASEPLPFARSWDVAALVFAATAWFQAGRSIDAVAAEAADPLVVLLPFFGVAAATGLVLRAARWLFARYRTAGAGLPDWLFLSWRRIAAAQAGALGVTTAVALAIGLVVFSTVVPASVGEALDVKAIVDVGARTRADIGGRQIVDDDVPDGSTRVWSKAVTIRPGGGRVEVMIVDDGSFGSVVSWDDAFGIDPDAFIDLLAPGGDRVPAVAVGDLGGQATLSSATTFLEIDVVRTLPALPLSSSRFPTIYLGRAAVEEWDLEFRYAGLPAEGRPDREAFAAESWQSPTETFATTLLSTRPRQEVVDVLTALRLPFNAVIDIDERLTVIEDVATRSALGYLRALAAVSAVAAVAALMLYLAESQQNRRLAYALMRRMGLGRRTHLRAVTGELAGLIGIGAATAVGTALATSWRILPRFDPAPGAPPDPVVVVPPPVWAAIVGGVVLLVLLGARWVQFTADRARASELLRA